MKFRTKILSLLLLISLLLFPWLSLVLPLPACLKNTPQNLHILADSPLDIDGNAQLAAASSSGDGSSWNPYIIQDKIIDAGGLEKDGIRIVSTTVYFILRNCTITNVDFPYKAIRLSFVINARLENNTVHDNYQSGIELTWCDNNTLINNTANDNSFYGIRLYLCDNNTLIGNTANDNILGIYFSTSNKNNLTGNTANDNQNGVHFEYSNNNNLTSNTFNNNWDHGIYLFKSNFTIITGNILHENSKCIVEKDCSNNSIENNDCENRIPGFPWTLVLLGVVGLSLFVLIIKRKEDHQDLSLP